MELREGKYLKYVYDFLFFFLLQTQEFDSYFTSMQMIGKIHTLLSFACVSAPEIPSALVADCPCSGRANFLPKIMSRFHPCILLSYYSMWIFFFFFFTLPC